MKTIYNKRGETKILDTIDAKEHVSTGRWSYVPMTGKKGPKVVDDTSPDYVQSNESKEADDMAPVEIDRASNSRLEGDPTSQEAYDARKEAFKQSEAETAAKVAPIEEEIKKNKLAKK